MEMISETKVKKGTLPIKVSKEVVGHLSFGLYRNFARAAKEVVANSYDAGATEVKIKLDLDDGRIVVRDNGRGMDIEEVEEKFLTVGYRTPATEAPDELHGDSIIELNIDAKAFFKEDGTFRFVEQARVPYEIHASDLPKAEGETIVVLEGIKPHLVKELREKDFKGKSSIDKFSGFHKFEWTLSQYAALQFPPERKDLRELFETPKTVPMRLWLDGKELFRNVPEAAKILDTGERQFGNVSLSYAIMSSMGPVEPEEARGLQVRLRNAAIGLPRDFDVTKMTGKVLGKLNYICGEVQITSGLDSALMIDRDSFSYTEEISDIYNFFRKKLIQWNDTLEKWASEDKDIYESLINVRGSGEVIAQLQKADVLRFSRERLRLPKAPMVQKKGRAVLPQHQRLVKALSRAKGFDIISEKGKVSSKQPPVKVISKKHTILVYEEHPDLLESIEVLGKRLRVKYEEWDSAGSPYSICKLSPDNSVVTFNSSHPLFKSKLSDEIIKRLSLGILLISGHRRDREELLTKLNQLLTQTLLGE
jgi:hypothetical protein